MDVYDRMEKTRRQYIKLMLMRRALKNVCNTINKEIMQADVEWMNLCTLLKNKKKQAETNKGVTQPGKPRSPRCIITSHIILPRLDLNLRSTPSVQPVQTEEEFDSDSDDD